MQHRLHTVQQEKAEIESALLQLERIQAQEAREEKQRAIAAAVVGQAASDRLYDDAFSRQRVPTPLNQSLYLATDLLQPFNKETPTLAAHLAVIQHRGVFVGAGTVGAANEGAGQRGTGVHAQPADFPLRSARREGTV